MRHLRECNEKGNDLEEVERVVRKGLCYGSTTFGVAVLCDMLPQVTLRATQRLAIVGRFHRPAWWRVRPMRDEQI